MAPLNADHITDERIVVGRDGPLEAAIGACLARVPDAVGINNHMGSSLTQDPVAVARFLRHIQGGGRWLLDSRTTPRSLLCSQAWLKGVPCIQRDVFLDDPSKGSSKGGSSKGDFSKGDVTSARLADAIRIARHRGWAVVIGHPLPATLKALREVLRLDEGPIQVVRVGEVIGTHMTLDRATY